VRADRQPFRLTFLWRFTLLMLVVSTLAAGVLGYAVEQAHRAAVVTDIETAALSLASAELAKPLDRVDAGARQSTQTKRDLASAVGHAVLFQYVTGLRIFRPSGELVYPSPGLATPTDVGDVHAALSTDTFFSRERGDSISAFQPIFTDDERAFVIAVDFSVGQFAVAFAREREQVIEVVGASLLVVFLSLVTLAAGASRELERRRRESRHTFVQTLEVMAETIDLRDPYTAGHSKRVAVYSRQLAEAVGMRRADVESIEGGALLHDIGKIAIPDRVLFKPAKLEPGERAIIESHPVVGAKLLANVPAMDEVTQCVLHHHERLDGKGYPDGLAGDAIPIGSRVIAVADTFDAMTTDRPYRRGLSIDAAIAEMRRVAGTQLDASLVDVFLKMIDDGRVVILQKPVAPDVDLPAFGRKLEVSLKT
jgi:putative nucleotidyltransferase with HDIG domain